MNPVKSKTKCLAFNQKHPASNMSVDGIQIPWVEQAVHLGHVINIDQCTSHDASEKRGIFIGKTHALQQELGDQHPSVMLRLRWTYATAFYGSNLWDLSDPPCGKLCSSWNRSVRLTFKIPINTHRYILQELYPKADLKYILLNRFKRFSRTLQSSSKPEVVHLERLQGSDYRSSYGRNKQLPACDPNPFVTPEDQTWRVGVVRELLEVRDSDMVVPGFTFEELQIMLDSCCKD